MNFSDNHQGKRRRPFHATAAQCRARRQAKRLIVEALEERTLLTVDFVPFGMVAPAVNLQDVPLGISSGTVEPMVTVNDADPRIVAVSSQSRLRRSVDAGATFASSISFNDFLDDPLSSGGDTDTAFDANGRLYWTNLARDPDNTVPRYVAVASLDYGANNSFVGSVAFTPNSNDNDDKQFLTTDNDPQGISPFAGNLYVVWTTLGNTPGVELGTEVFLSRSTDGGNRSTPGPNLPLPSGPTGWPARPTTRISSGRATWPSPRTEMCTLLPLPTGLRPGRCRGRGGPDVSTARSSSTLNERRPDLRHADRGLHLRRGRHHLQRPVCLRAIPSTNFWMSGAGQPWILARPGPNWRHLRDRQRRPG